MSSTQTLAEVFGNLETEIACTAVRHASAGLEEMTKGETTQKYTPIDKLVGALERIQGIANSQAGIATAYADFREC